ncbi:unnamed protein product, partial [Brachionus calyciflorus]
MSENPIVIKFRDLVLQRGPAGIKEIGRYFRQIDDDKSHSLSFDEFFKGILDHNIGLTKTEASELFKIFDKNENDRIDYDELLIAVRPPLNRSRMVLIIKAFQKMDKTGDRRITIDDLKGTYSAKQNPRYLSGELTEDQVFRHFLESFEAHNHKDGIVTLDEFVQYYAGVSACIDSDIYFDFMMRNA